LQFRPLSLELQFKGHNMNSNDISFPHLGIYLKNVPFHFTLFGKFDIAMYGIIFAIGVVAGIYVASKLAKEEGQNEDQYWSFAIWEIICSLIGARIYYIIFSWDRFKDPFIQGKIGEGLLGLINLRRGGIAIYGAVIAAFITLFIYCKKTKVNPYIYGDTAIPGLIIGQVMGRWGNFFNREVFGEYTDSLFAMRLPVDGQFVRHEDISVLQSQKMAEAMALDPTVNYIQAHPTFFYESVWNLCVFIGLLLYRKHKKFNGEICLLYFAGYGIGRFWIEGIRTDQLMFFGTGIPVSQIVAIILILIAIVGEVLARVNLKKGTLPESFRVRTAEEKKAEAEKNAQAAKKKQEAAEKKDAESHERVEYIIEASEPDMDDDEEDDEEDDEDDGDK